MGDKALGRTIEDRNFFREYYLAGLSILAFVWALAGPRMRPGLDSPLLAPWAALLLLIAVLSFLRLLRPVHRYPQDDFVFVFSLALAVNFFSCLFGPETRWLQPLNYVLIALCAIYYSIGFNLLAASLILAMEAAGAHFSQGGLSSPSAGLIAFGTYLFGAALVFGALFRAEQKKRERAMQTVRRLKEGAESVAGDMTVSPEGRMSAQLASAAELDRVLDSLLRTARTAIPSDNALLFMSAQEDESLYLRVYLGTGDILDDTVIPSGQGLVGWVMREKRPMIAQGANPGLGYLRDEKAVRSAIAVPVMNGGYLEGVLVLDSTRDEAFAEPDKETLAGFAAVALHLLKNARAYYNADLSAKNFEALHKISSEVSASLDAETIVGRLAELIKDIVPYDYLTVSFVEGEMAAFMAAEGYEGAKKPDGPVAYKNTLLGWVIENRQSLFFTDIDQRAEKLPVFPNGFLKADVRSFLGVPFVSHEETLGVMTVAMRGPRMISAYQQNMMSIVANQVAVSISNARMHETLQLMATTDGLTGLINNRHFHERADEEFERAKRYPVQLAVLLFDIDRFKTINDTYGHPVGDAVLRKVARIMKDAVRTVDIAARYGGEEFVILLLNTGDAGAQQLAERIRLMVEKGRFILDGVNIPVTISAGYAVYPDDGDDKKDLIAKADQALYFAKRTGRNRCCSYRSVNTGAGPPGSEG